MNFADPGRLWLLAVVGALLVVYIAVQARRGTYALRFSDTGLLDTVAPKRPRWRRHLVALTFLASLASLVIAIAGPFREEQILRERATVVLTIDTSLSMGAEDVSPTRIDAAKQAALAFLDDVPETVDVGLVSFNGIPTIRVPPTSDRLVLADAIRSLELGEATATGDAIFASLEAITTSLARGDGGDDGGAPLPDGSDDETVAVVVLLSDGTPTIPAPPPDNAPIQRVLDAIDAAVESSIPVSTVAFGTAEGSVTIPNPDFPSILERVPVPVDEPTLELIANGTDGTFFTADSADELEQVYDDIGTAVGFDVTERDISDWFTMTAFILAALTALLSLWWFQRIP